MWKKITLFALVGLTAQVWCALPSEEILSDDDMVDEAVASDWATELMPVQDEITRAKYTLKEIKMAIIRTIENMEVENVAKMDAVRDSVIEQHQRDLAAGKRTTQKVIDSTEQMGPQYAACLEGYKAPAIDAFTVAHESLQQCDRNLQEYEDKYSSNMKTIRDQLKIAEDSIVSSFVSCMPPSDRMTSQDIERATSCVRESTNDFISSYYKVYVQVFSVIANTEMGNAKVLDDATSCVKASLASTAQPSNELFVSVYQCSKNIRKPPHVRFARGFFDKLKSFLGKVRDGAVQLCMVVPCQSSVAVATVGK